MKQCRQHPEHPEGQGLSAAAAAAAAAGMVLGVVVAQSFEVRRGFSPPWSSAHSDAAAVVNTSQGESCPPPRGHLCMNLWGVLGCFVSF